MGGAVERVPGRPAGLYRPVASDDGMGAGRARAGSTRPSDRAPAAGRPSDDDEMTRSERAVGWVVGAVVLAVSLAGCAGAPTSGPRRMQADDFKWLAGQWRGSSYVQAEPATNIEGVIYENGSFFIGPVGCPGPSSRGR